ncbi:MAG: HAD-IC family P-type ATPase, partial [Anaerolineae bacterium]|nr:HAD-IC family P-type ATPase [Anaerolineae bacterium]
MLPTSHGSMLTVIQRLSQLDEIEGLDEIEVLTRRERGEGNAFKLATSRSLFSILRQNVFTVINVVLFTIGGMMVSIGRTSEAVTSVSLIAMNILVGVVQELRAKRKLDEIALLTRPQVTVMREGEERVVDPAELVRGDIIVARPGDQVVVDGIVVGDGVIEVDESQLTGESDHIRKEMGDHVLSGSYVVSGSAMYIARRVGAKSFANQVSTEAREFVTSRTPLQRDIDFVIRFLMLIALFFAVLFGLSAVLADIPLMRGVQMASVIAGLIPNGLFFMVIVAYAMGAVRIATSGALVQQSNSVESLSNVNVLCMDKTGTLTANRITYHDVYPLDGDKAEVKAILGDLGRSCSASNKTSEALVKGLAGEKRRVLDEVPFSSVRKWSAISFSDAGREGVYVLGALEMLEPYIDSVPQPLHEQADVWTAQGLRVVLLAYSPEVTYLHDSGKQPVLPPLTPLALVSFSDELRPEAEETLACFVAAGIKLKVISGDNPHTVAALAQQAGLPGDLRVISGPELKTMSDAEFAQVAREVSIFGRITPLQKERLVDSLREQGYYVAMIGDGVNDVLSLKKAHLGIAMESGSSATRSVADIVLLNDSFAALAPAFLEGQRITSGMRDILRLYMARAVQIILVIIAISVIGMGFPYIPKHSTLVAILTIGVPTFALAVWAKPEQSDRGLIVSVTHFAFPAGIVTFLFGLLLYAYTFDDIVNHNRTLNVMSQDVETFQTYAGIDYEIFTADAFRYEVATLHAQTVLTMFSALA